MLNRFATCLLSLVALAVLPVAAQTAQEIALLGGDASGVRNSDGALVVSYAAGRTSETFRHLAGRTPLIWARYNPGASIGTILVTRAVRRPNGGVDIVVTPFRPADAARFATGGHGQQVRYFGGINPFAQFDAGDTYFRNINFTAFLAATGLVMRTTQSSVAFVYYPGINLTSSASAAGSDIAWGASGTVNYTMEGRWLLGLPADTGDRAGFIPAFRVVGCNPVIDTRNGCVVKGFASFLQWDFGNLPNTALSLGNRTASQTLDLTAMSSAFGGLEAYLRDASLWNDAAWSSIGGTSASNAQHATRAAGIANADAARRDRLGEVYASGSTTLASATGTGVVTPGASGFWDGSDLATTEFINKSIGAAGGGLGTTFSATDWQQARDRKAAQDVLIRRGGQASTQSISGVAPQ